MDSSAIAIEQPSAAAPRGRGRGRSKESVGYKELLPRAEVEHFRFLPIRNLGRGESNSANVFLNAHGESNASTGQELVGDGDQSIEGTLDNLSCSSKQNMKPKTRKFLKQDAEEILEKSDSSLSHGVQFVDGEPVDEGQEFQIKLKPKTLKLFQNRMDRHKVDSKTFAKVCAHDKSTPIEVNAAAFCAVSKVFKEMWEMGSYDMDSSDIIHLQVNYNILGHIIKWAETQYYEEYVPDPLDLELEQNFMKYISKRDVLFIQQFSIEKVHEIAQAAQYLEIDGLHFLCAKACYHRLQGKKPRDMRKEMLLSNEFTNLEENNVRKQNEWYVDMKTMKF